MADTSSYTQASLKDADVSGKTVLLRVDINVPIQQGKVTDDTRIQRVLPTITDLSKRGAKVVLLSHFGRPKGKASDEHSLRQVLPTLSESLGDINVQFADDCIGDSLKSAIAELNNGDVLLCENLRFHAQEEQGDAAFAKQIAAQGDIYVNDAFSCSHRAHASISGISEHLPSYFGYAMLEELSMLERVFAHPKAPVAALVGGSKISTKMALLEHLVEKMDILMIGGGMANTFLYAQGHDVGASLCEPDLKSLALSVLEKAHTHQCRILLPEDVVAASAFAAHAPCRIVDADAIGEGEMALDIGPKTVARWQEAIEEANTLVWNGPAGAFETTPFDSGTVALARSIAYYTEQSELASVAGGGDTVSALTHSGLTEQMTYVSTAGGAFLEWLEGKTLPGVAAIEAQSKRLAS